jgi:hypothetical protein
LWLIRIECGLLFVAAVLSMEFFAGATFYLIYACVFLATLIVLLYDGELGNRCRRRDAIPKTLFGAALAHRAVAHEAPR